MSVERAAAYRRKAQECLEHSKGAIVAEDKAAWLKMAEGWEHLAQNAEAKSGTAIQVEIAQLVRQEPAQTD